MEAPEIIRFSDLYTMDFTLTDVAALSQRWHNGCTFRMDYPRRTNALIYLNRCCGRYTDCRRNSFEAVPGSLVCLPRGSRYQVENHDCAEAPGDAWLVEFNLSADGRDLTFGDAPFPVRGPGVYRIGLQARKAAAAFEAAARSPVSLLAAVYAMLVQAAEDAHREESRKYRVILPGIRLLEENVLEAESVEDLAAACGVSSGCFRRLFRAYLGKTPVEYRTELRMQMARSMLENSDASLELIATSLGYDSAAYFCRIFRRKMGMPPGAYRAGQRKMPGR